MLAVAFLSGPWLCLSLGPLQSNFHELTARHLEVGDRDN